MDSGADPLVASEVSFHGLQEAVGVVGRGKHSGVLSILEFLVSFLYFLFKVVGSHEIDDAESQCFVGFDDHEGVVDDFVFGEEVDVVLQYVVEIGVDFLLQEVGMVVFVDFEVAVETGESFSFGGEIQTIDF